MDFGIKRLPFTAADDRRYHLYDQTGKLILVADSGSPWLRDRVGNHVRFATPSGVQMATLDLTYETKRQRNGRQHVAYAVIVDHAVFCIINKYWQDKTDAAPRPYFVLEVAELLWLVLQKPGDAPNFALFTGLPADLLVYNEPAVSDLPDPIGHIYHDVGGYDYNLMMPAKGLGQPSLIALVLAFLIDLD